MSFQLTRTHTSVVLAATTIAASLVVIPTLAEGTATSEDAFCNSLSGAEGRITAEYNPLLASYAAAAAGNSSVSAADPAREAELRAALADAQAAGWKVLPLKLAKSGVQITRGNLSKIDDGRVFV